MKKLLLMLGAVCYTALSFGQFFQKHYGITTSVIDDDYLQFGSNTRLIGDGHLMSGITFNTLSTTSGFYRLTVVKTDSWGNFSTGNDFANEYFLYDAAGYQLDIDKAEALEIDPNISSSGAQYAVIGSAYEQYSTPGTINYYVFYLELDNAGNLVGSASLYYLGTSTSDYITHFTNARLDIGGQSIYAVGYCESTLIATPNTEGFVMKFDITASPVNLTWSTRFTVPTGGTIDETYPNDVIESPYASNNNVIVVGASITGGNRDAFVQHLNIGTGALVGNATIYGSSTTNEHFQAINIMNSTALSTTAGFVVGGTTNFGLSSGTDGWICFFNPGMGLVNTSQLNYTGGATHSIMDVTERLNTSSQYEYYTSGVYAAAGATNTEMLVFKYEPVAATVGVFEYGVNIGDESGVSIDYYDAAGSPNGIAAYGNTDGSWATATGSDFYLVKAYFNGVAPCSVTINTGADASSARRRATFTPSSAAGFTSATLFTSLGTTVDADTICSALTVGGGSNAFHYKPAADPTGGNQLNTGITSTFGIGQVQPNPIAANSNATLALNAYTNVNVTVTIVDMLGRTFQVGQFKLQQGTNQVKLDLTPAQLNRGCYFLRVDDGHAAQTTLLYID